MVIIKIVADLQSTIFQKSVKKSPAKEIVSLKINALGLTIESKTFTTLRSTKLNFVNPILTKLKVVTTGICARLLIMRGSFQ